MADRLPETPARSVLMALIQAEEALSRPFHELFRDRDLTGPRFNVLRILLQGPKQGVRCGEIGEQLIHAVPDVTRLVDRMERDGLVVRHRDAEDRRRVYIRITPAGRKLCRGTYPQLNHLHRELLAHMSEKEQQQLNKLLRKAYEPHRK